MKQDAKKIDLPPIGFWQSADEDHEEKYVSPYRFFSAEDWAAGLEVCLTGSYLLARGAARQMGEQGGSIIHFSSMYGMVSPDPRLYEDLLSPNPPDYGAAKAGIIVRKHFSKVSISPW